MLLNIAQVVAHREELPPARLGGENAEVFRVLADDRNELVAEAGRLRNRLHAKLFVLVLGCKTQETRLLSATGR